MAAQKAVFTFHNVSINSMKMLLTSLHKLSFTFHNVSINSLFFCSCVLTRTYNLHSTMFLLILSYVTVYSLPHLFTFHNVSINSGIRATFSYRCIMNLHSTMFLLIRVSIIFNLSIYVFTFHNVSINSNYIVLKFNNKIDIYIPQCFY